MILLLDITVMSSHGIIHSMTRHHPDNSSGHTHTQTDGIDIQPHTTQTINERTSAESDLVTAQSKHMRTLKMV